jgi:hypothetical protein
VDDNQFPQWAYGPDGQSDVFNSADEIPAGWVNHPSKVKGAPDTSDSGVKTPIASANGDVSEAKVAKSTTAASETHTDPAKAAKSGVGGKGNTPVTGVTASQSTGSDVSGNTAEIDAYGHPFDANLHAATRSKTKAGLWRLKGVGAKRADPAPGYPKPAQPLDL